MRDYIIISPIIEHLIFTVRLLGIEQYKRLVILEGLNDEELKDNDYMSDRVEIWEDNGLILI